MKENNPITNEDLANKLRNLINDEAEAFAECHTFPARESSAKTLETLVRTLQVLEDDLS